MSTPTETQPTVEQRVADVLMRHEAGGEGCQACDWNQAVRRRSAGHLAAAAVAAVRPHIEAEVTSVMQDDVRQLLDALGLSTAARYSPHQVVVREVIPAVKAMWRTAAEHQADALRKAATNMRVQAAQDAGSAILSHQRHTFADWLDARAQRIEAGQ